MRKALSFLLAMLLALSVLTACGTQKANHDGFGPVYTPEENETVLYVAVSGDDTAEGTRKAPLATLDGARAKVRSLLSGTDGRITVIFAAGDYPVTESVAFDAADSGKDGAPVTYRAAEGEQVRFVGGIRVDPSLVTKADPDSSVTARVVDETAKAALMQADVSSLLDVYPDIFHCDRVENNRDVFLGDWNSMQIYLGDTAIIPARWPNDGPFDTANVVSFNRETPDFDYDIATAEGTQRAVFYFYDEVTERSQLWSDESLADAYVTGCLRHAYLGNRVKLRSIDRENGCMDVGPSSNGLGLSEAREGFFENIPEEIDIPGESYIDRNARIAYFYPGEDFSADDVWISTLEVPMMTFDSTEHIAFDGLSFCYSRATVIDSHHVKDFAMTGCRLVHLSAKAAFFFDAADVHLDGCEIGDTEHGGIFLSGGDRNTLESSGIVIENCDLHDFNRDWFATSFSGTNEPALNDAYCCEYPAGLYVQAVGTIIRHNAIHDSQHCAILPESNDILIENNEIYRVCRYNSDMGAIYYFNNPTFLGLTIRNNYFHEIGGVTGSCQFAVYTDCGSMGPDIYNNLFVNSAGVDVGDPLRPKGVISLAQFAHIHNNIFVNAEAIFRYGDWSAGTGIRQSDWVLYLYNRGKYAGMGTPSRFQEVDYDSEIWHARYDDTIWGNIYDYFSFEMLEEMNTLDEKSAKNKAAGISPYKTNEMDNNVLADVHLYVNDELDRSLNLHDNYKGGTEVFRDAANGDYTLTDEALAEIREACPGFEMWDLTDVGIKK